mmetsp:Transcript_13143/g.23550  ORF Transcript_13143/g.23550 Transcript_13143/m.23550 type:complete len:301 (+) Transcript_13143:255-1157(+)
MCYYRFSTGPISPVFFPSCRLRRYEAHTQSCTTVRNPPRSAKYNARAVVPPGEVISLRSATTDFSEALTFFTVPKTVCSTKRVAKSRDRPKSTPASIIDSIHNNIYAGPLPLTAVAMSRTFSSLTNSSFPIVDKSPRTNFLCSGPTSGLAHQTVIPSRILVGVFGIDRTTRGIPSPSFNTSTFSPATIEIAVTGFGFFASFLPISLNAASAYCGLTARTTTSQFSISCPASSVRSYVFTPYFSERISLRPAWGSIAARSNLPFESSRPDIIASAIAPPPINKILPFKSSQSPPVDIALSP